MNFYNKYLKYKKKYIELKKLNGYGLDEVEKVPLSREYFITNISYDTKKKGFEHSTDNFKEDDIDYIVDKIKYQDPIRKYSMVSNRVDNSEVLGYKPITYIVYISFYSPRTKLIVPYYIFTWSIDWITGYSERQNHYRAFLNYFPIELNEKYNNIVKNYYKKYLLPEINSKLLDLDRLIELKNLEKKDNNEKIQLSSSKIQTEELQLKELLEKKKLFISELSKKTPTEIMLGKKQFKESYELITEKLKKYTHDKDLLVKNDLKITSELTEIGTKEIIEKFKEKIREEIRDPSKFDFGLGINNPDGIVYKQSDYDHDMWENDF